MKTIEAQMAEIGRRKRYYRARRAERRLAGLCAGLCALLIAALMLAPGVTGSPVGASGSVLGATILGPEAGGYVIVALLAFGLGVVAALLIQKRQRIKADADEKKETEA